MKRLLSFLMSLLLLLVLNGCHQRSATGTVVTNDKEQEDKDAPWIEGNKKILNWETEEIELFIKRYNWNMERTGTGLHIQILQEGTGNKFVEGDKVTVEYQTFLLSGEKVYDSKEDGVKTFTVDKSEEITALHEAVKMLKPGATARLVIPTHLAYGVAGDGNKINGRLPIAMIIHIQ